MLWVQPQMLLLYMGILEAENQRIRGLKMQGENEYKSPNYFSELQVSFELLRYRMEKMRNTAAGKTNTHQTIQNFPYWTLCTFLKGHSKAESLIGLTRR